MIIVKDDGAFITMIMTKIVIKDDDDDTDDDWVETEFELFMGSFIIIIIIIIITLFYITIIPIFKSAWHHIIKSLIKNTCISTIKIFIYNKKYFAINYISI